MSEVIFWLLGLWLGVVWAFSTVTEDQFAKAQEMCKTNGGMIKYVSNSVGYPDVTCKNGAKFTIKDEVEGK
jgi:hypothetical protein